MQWQGHACILSSMHLLIVQSQDFSRQRSYLATLLFVLLRHSVFLTAIGIALTELNERPCAATESPVVWTTDSDVMSELKPFDGDLTQDWQLDVLTDPVQFQVPILPQPEASSNVP